MPHFEVAYVDGEDRHVINLDVEPQYFENAAYYAVKHLKEKIDKDGIFHPECINHNLFHHPDEQRDGKILNQK